MLSFIVVWVYTRGINSGCFINRLNLRGIGWQHFTLRDIIYTMTNLLLTDRRENSMMNEITNSQIIIYQTKGETKLENSFIAEQCRKICREAKV